jgi:hypothetical protein
VLNAKERLSGHKIGQARIFRAAACGEVVASCRGYRRRMVRPERFELPT